MKPSDADAVDALADRLDLARRLEPFAAHRWMPGAPQPVLHLEDVSAIPFLSGIDGVEEYQHRARVRAETGDSYATATPPDPVYEEYCQQRLGFGVVDWLPAEYEDDRLAVARGCCEGPTFDRLVGMARDEGGLTIHPYMGIDDVWQLAEQLSQVSHQPVAVLAPPPPVTWIANDKALFTELVEILLGPGWTPETFVSSHPDQMAKHLRDLATRHAAVGLKRTRCASATGNQVFRSDSLRSSPPTGVEDRVRTFLERTEWPGFEPVLQVAWEDTDHSPSTQWWIPPLDQGTPTLDGIYEQILVEDRKLFVGSRPSTLPATVHRVLGDAGLTLATGLQRLGYVGRCSFDHLVLGDPGSEFLVRFTECNGRWGGTSTPMCLVDRVVRGPRPCYRAQDFVHPRLADLDFAELLTRVGAHAWDFTTQRGRYIFYNVGPLAEFGKLDIIAMGETQAAAEQALLADLPRLLHL